MIYKLQKEWHEIETSSISNYFLSRTARRLLTNTDCGLKSTHPGTSDPQMPSRIIRYTIQNISMKLLTLSVSMGNEKSQKTKNVITDIFRTLPVFSLPAPSELMKYIIK